MSAPVAYRLLLQLGCACCLLACASHHKSDQTKSGSTKDSDANASANAGGSGHSIFDFHSSMKKAQSDLDAGKMNPMEKKVFSAVQAFPGSKEEYKARDLPMDKEFKSGKKDYKPKDFAQAGKVNKSFDKKFSGSDRKNSLEGKTFTTKESTFGSKNSKYENKLFRLSKENFHTPDDIVGTKAFEKSKAPKMYSSPNKTYSEDDVQKMLNKS